MAEIHHQGKQRVELAVKQKEFLTTAEVANICKCSHDTVKRWLENQQLAGHRLTPQGRWRILPRDLVKFMDHHGFPIGEEARAVLGLPQPAVKDFVYCWEFHKRNKTHPAIEGKECEDCLVFRTKARECFVLRDQSSHNQIFCDGPCEGCEYYRYSVQMEIPRGAPEA